MGGLTVSRRFVRMAVSAGLLGALLPVAIDVAKVSAVSRTWNGLGGSNNWSDGGNWVGGQPPVENDALVFPAGPTKKQATNDYAHGTDWDSITISGAGYSLGGQQIETDTIAVTATGDGYMNFSGPQVMMVQQGGILVPSGGTLNINVAAGGKLDHSGGYEVGSGVIVYDIDGTMTDRHQYGPPNADPAVADIVSVGSGELRLVQGGGNLVQWSVQGPGTTTFYDNPTYQAEVTVTGGTFGGAQGFVKSIHVQGGTFSPGATTGSGSVLNPASYNIDGNLSLQSTGSLTFDLNNANSDSIGVNGTVALGNSTLVINAPGFAPYAGQTITLINNDMADAVTGTFAGLAEGAAVSVNGGTMNISYAGGSNSNDVVLTSGTAEVWDGPAAGQWTTGANWLDNSAPTANGTPTLEFTGAGVATAYDYAAGSTFNHLVMNGGPWDHVGVNSLKLNGAIVSNTGGGSNTLSLPVELVGGGELVIPQAGGYALVVDTDGALSADGGTITVVGQGIVNVLGQLLNDLPSEGATTGQVVLSGSNGGMVIGAAQPTFAGPITLNGANSYLQVTAELAQAGVVVNSGSFSGGTPLGTNTIQGLTATGGTVYPGLQASPGGVLTVDGNLSMTSNAKLNLDMNTATVDTGYDRVVVNGDVDLTGAELVIDSISSPTPPPAGPTYLIVDKVTPGAITGTFENLPEGATVNVKGVPMKISYVGGVDGNDVTLSVPNAFTWDGSASANWSDGANWAGNAAPIGGGGETLIFPAGAGNKANTNNIGAALSFANIIFTETGYNLSGNAITLTGEVNAVGNNALSWTNTLTLPITLGGDRTWTAGNMQTIVLIGAVTIGDGNELTLTGVGAWDINPTVPGTGGLVDGALNIISPTPVMSPGFVKLGNAPMLDGPIVVNGGNLQLNGSTPAAIQMGTVNAFASVFGAGTTGPISLTGTSSIAPGIGNVATISVNGALSMSAGSPGVQVDLNGTGAGQFDQIITSGPVTLAGFLGISSSASPTLGVPVTLINNTGPDPISGTFAGIPEGGLVNLNFGGPDWVRISYVGGIGGNDVTATRVNTFIWDGDTSASMNDNNNWTGGAKPTDGGVVIFPSLGFGSLLPNNDVAGLTTLSEIQFTGIGYTLGGATLTVSGGVSSSNGFGENIYNLPTTFSGGGTISTVGGGTLTVNNTVDMNGGTLTLTGGGTVKNLSGFGDGNLTIAAAGSGIVNVTGTMPLMSGTINVQGGTLVLNDTLANADLNLTGGRVVSNVAGGGADDIVASGGSLSPADFAKGTFQATGNVAFSGTHSYRVDLTTTTPGTGHDQLHLTDAPSTLALGGTLDVDFDGVPTMGDQYVIISNEGVDAVTGAFTGLAEGASFMANGTSFTISYAGGSNNNDVVLTVGGATVSLSTAAVALAEGNTGSNTSVGLTVQLSSAQPTDVVVHVTATNGTGTAGTDTSALDQDLTILATQTSVAVPFTITGDDTVEGDETVDVTLTMVSGATVAAPSVATVTINNDDAAPSVTIDKAGGQADPTSTSPIQFTVVFSESVTGFATGDVTLGGTAGATTAVVSGSGANYTVDVTGMSADGTVIATINAGVATDSGANANTASTSTDNSVDWVQPVDSTPPSVTINQGSGQADPTSTEPIVFDVVFSETVTGFDGADVTLGGTAGATTANVSGSGTTYTVSVTGMTTDGTVTASVNAGGAIDGAANPNTASTSTDNTVTWSTTPVTTSTTTTTTTTTPGSTTTTTPGATTTTTPGTVPPPGPGGIVINTPGGQVSLEVVSGGALQTFTWGPLSVPPPDGYIMPFGELSFTASAAPAGGLVVLKMVLPMSPAAYFKLAGPAWQNFVFNGETGSQIIGNTIVLTIRDNGRGDTNPAAGLIADPSAPAIPAPDLPATGTDSIAYIQLALMAVGTGVLVLVSRRRRRRRAVAAN